MRKEFVVTFSLFLPLMILLVFITWIPSYTSSAAESTVIIAAVYYDGYESGEPDEAVRLINVSDTAVDLFDWGLTDNSSTARFPAGAQLAGKESIWLAKDGHAFARQFGHAADYDLVADNNIPDLNGTWPGFANSGDEVVLLDGADELVDALVYEGGSSQQAGWSGAAVQPYVVSGVFAAEGQILYRKLDPQQQWPVADTDTAADWAQEMDDPLYGRKLLYPGWDLEAYGQPMLLAETAVLTVAIAPDNAYETVVAQISAAQKSLRVEALTFENLGIMEALITALQRGVAVTVLLEEDPAGGIPDQEKYICGQLEAAGGQCWFMLNDSDMDIFDRYRFLHAKFILVDDERVVISSENLSANSMPYDDKTDGTWGRRGVVLVTDAPGVVDHVGGLFAADFDPAVHQDITSTAYIGGPPPGFEPIDAAGGITYTVRYPVPATFQGRFDFEIVQSPENSLYPLGGLLGLLQNAGAGDTVLVQQLQERPYWGGTDSNPQADPNLRLEAMIAAARRGAEVRLLLDAYFDNPQSPVSNAATCAYVREIAAAEALALACRLGNPAGLGIHNKMVLAEIDNRGYLHVGSINGTEASNKGNRELALQVQSDAAYAYLASMFAADWGYSIFLPGMSNSYIPPANHMLISEVLYNPFGTDEKEFIELVNPRSDPLDISGYGLGDAVAKTDFEDLRRFPPGTVVPPGGTLVVAVAASSFAAEYGLLPDFEILDTETAVPNLIDDPQWGSTNTFFQLGNSGDEIILRDRLDLVIDVVTYGNGLYPGQVPCALVITGNTSLERLPFDRDTDNCPADFREWPFPNPGSLP